jgi:hypothetical protein
MRGMVGLEPTLSCWYLDKLKYWLPIGWLPTYLANLSKLADSWHVKELPNVCMPKVCVANFELSIKCPY